MNLEIDADTAEETKCSSRQNCGRRRGEENSGLRSEKQEEALAMAAELGRFLDPPPDAIKVLGPSEAPVARLKAEYRYQMLVKATSRVKLNEVLQRLRRYAQEKRWSATALVIDVDPLTLM